MQDETKPIPRLDRSKPPPGYVFLGHDRTLVVRQEASGDLAGKPLAMSLVWDRHEGEEDPPGMVTRWEADDRCCDSLEVGEWHVEVGAGGPARLVWHASFDNQGDVKRDDVWMLSTEWARRVAWKWYWRRVRLCKRLDDLAASNKYLGCVGVFEVGGLWPDALTWSDDYVLSIEAVICSVEVAS